MYTQLVNSMDRNKSAFAKLLIEAYAATGISAIREAIIVLVSGLKHRAFCNSSSLFAACFRKLPESIDNWKIFYKGLGYGINEGWFEYATVPHGL